jgi:hypothetical protein
MRSRQLVAGLVILGVVMVWVYSLGLRLHYMDQVPMYDADATTTEAHMWARMWWNEGPLKMWFSTPYAPRSIELPTRTLYESWPPGAFVPIYLAARFLGIEPSIPLVNWINTVLHGLIALAAAFTVFNLALMNRLGNLSSGLFAVAVAFPILISRGPIFVFSQIYDVTNAVLIYTTIFILLETLFYSTQSSSEKRIITALQLVTIYPAFFVDWLSYTVFAFWLVSRLVAGYLDIEARMTLRRLASLAVVPVSAFFLYFVWRLFAPDSSARTHGLAASLNSLVYKVLERMNLTEEEHRTGILRAFMEMHADYYSEAAFLLIIISAFATLALIVISYRRVSDPLERRSVFATGAILALITIPFYLHMIVLSQHSYIHRWAIMKAMLAYAMIPFALLPICLFTLIRLFAPQARWRRAGLAAISMVFAVCAIFFAEKTTRQNFQLMGPINRNAYLMWDDIGRNTQYQDVVFSPVLEAEPMTREVGASYKLVHHASNFADVDRVVQHVCGDFNVVVALPKGTEPGAFASRQPSQVLDTGRLRLLWFTSYKGNPSGCS